MALTLEREPTADRLSANMPGAPRSVASTETGQARGGRPRHRSMRWTVLAALAIAVALTALVARADSASPPDDGGTTVDVEPLEQPETTSPTSTEQGAGGFEVGTFFEPFRSGDDRPTCGALTWSLQPCPEKAAP